MTLHARWLRFRNRHLADPAFQARAAASPLLRWQARREAAASFDLVAGFVHAQILAACVDLDLFALLGGEPRDAAALARATGLAADPLDRLLRGATALGLVEAVDARWTLGSRGAALTGNAGALAMVAHHRAFYADLADPVALLRRGGGGGALQRYWAYARSPDSAGAPGPDVAAYSALMAASQPMVAAQLLGAWDFRGSSRVIDVGGGDGAFARALAAAHPRLALGVFDLPAVAARARDRLDAAGLDQVATHGGSFFTTLPDGYDTATLVRILHDHDDAPALALLRAVRAALPAGGHLLIGEPMAGNRPSRVGDAYFGLYLLAMGQGRARRPRDIAALCRTAGFASARPLRTALPLVAGAIVATA